MKKRAFISGISGQDGAWLAKLLIEKGYTVFGGVRSKKNFIDWRLKHLGVFDSVQYLELNLLDLASIESCIQTSKPDEFYNLAAQSSVIESYKHPVETSLVDGIGVLYILEALRKFSPNAKFFQASSSEIFGNCEILPHTENTPIRPTSPYAIAKAFAHSMNISYRNSFDMFCVNGILYSHESELRGEDFFSRKISLHVANWHLGNKKILEVGNIESEKDWGYAREFAEGMFLSLQSDISRDYIFATGNKTKVKNFIDYSFGVIGINLSWEGEKLLQRAFDSKTNELVIQINPKFYRPVEIHSAYGDATKANKLLNWKPNLDYKKISEIMVTNDIDLLKKNAKTY